MTGSARVAPQADTCGTSQTHEPGRTFRKSAAFLSVSITLRKFALVKREPAIASVKAGADGISATVFEPRPRLSKRLGLISPPRANDAMNSGATSRKRFRPVASPG
jgi:hypothetical protein